MSSLLRLSGLPAAQLPPAEASPHELAPLLISLLQEGVPLIDSVAPREGGAGGGPSGEWKSRGTKSYPSSTAPVHLYERTLGIGKEEERETWACRRSVHADSASEGTACWDEFRASFKERHVVVEGECMPSVVGADEVFGWRCEGFETEEAGTTYGNFTLCLATMRHRIGKPVLKDRVFPILQMTCSALDTDNSNSHPQEKATKELPEFLIITITIPDLLTSPFLSSNNNPAAAAAQSLTTGTVVAAYASVERFRKLLDGDIEWIMATASDARGVLPMWVQTRAVPGQIAKDVPYFFSWIRRQPTLSGG